MDIRNKVEIDAIVELVESCGQPLHALVNNAGIATGCPLDWGSGIEQYHDVFEANVFGTVRVTKSFLPLLRKSKGRIVNVTSYASRIAQPFMASYCMTKFALRSFTDSLRIELKDDGIKVIGVEPFFYSTPIISTEKLRSEQIKLFKNTEDSIRAAYDNKKRNLIFNSNQITQMFMRYDITEVRDIMENAITLKHPKLFYKCSGYIDSIFWYIATLPELITDTLYEIILSPFILKFSEIICKILDRPIFPNVCADNAFE